MLHEIIIARTYPRRQRVKIKSNKQIIIKAYSSCLTLVTSNI